MLHVRTITGFFSSRLVSVFRDVGSAATLAQAVAVFFRSADVLTICFSKASG